MKDATTAQKSDYQMDLDSIRRSIKTLAREVLDAKKAAQAPPGSDIGEVIANVTLAYRHLEDASMRIGKALQAYDGGVSVYDRDTTVGA